MKLSKLCGALLAALILTFQLHALAAKPTVIRIGYPGVGVGNRPASFGNSVATAHLKGLLENEFKKDGITIRWTFLRGAGPAVNELFANGLLDFSHLGDLPSVVGRASGLKYRVLASSGVRNNIYVSVPADSTVQSVKDLRGKKVAVLKGTATHLAGVKILEKFGLSEKDVRLVNLDTNAAKAALVTKDIDAAFGGSDLIALREQGVARLIYNSRDDDPRFLRHCTFVGSQDFIDKYPEITKRVVKTLVLAAKWISDQDGAPTPVYQLYTKSGVAFSNYKEDLASQSIKVNASPLLDAYISSTYKANIQEAKRFGLIKNDIDFDKWVDSRFLEQALKELNLQNYWKPIDPSGNWK